MTPVFTEWFDTSGVTNRHPSYHSAVFINTTIRSMDAAAAGEAIGIALKAKPAGQRIVVDQSSLDQASPNPAQLGAVDPASGWLGGAVAYATDITTGYSTMLAWQTAFGTALAAEMGDVSIDWWHYDEEWVHTLAQIPDGVIDAIWGDTDALTAIQSQDAELGAMSATTAKARGTAASRAWLRWFKSHQRGAMLRAGHAAKVAAAGIAIPADNYGDLDLALDAREIYDLNGWTPPVNAFQGRSNRVMYLDKGNRAAAFASVDWRQVSWADGINACKGALAEPRVAHQSLTAWLRCAEGAAGGSWTVTDEAVAFTEAAIRHLWQLGVTRFATFCEVTGEAQAMNDAIARVVPTLPASPTLPTNLDAVSPRAATYLTGTAALTFSSILAPDRGTRIVRDPSKDYAVSLQSAIDLLAPIHWFRGGKYDDSGPPPDMTNFGTSEDKADIGSALLYNGLPTLVPQGFGAIGIGEASDNADALADLDTLDLTKPCSFAVAFSLADNATTQTLPARGQGSQSWLIHAQDGVATACRNMALGISNGELQIQYRRVATTTADSIYRRSVETVNESNPGPLVPGRLHVMIGTFSGFNGDDDPTAAAMYFNRVAVSLTSGGTGISPLADADEGLSIIRGRTTNGIKHVRVYEAMAFDFALSADQAALLYDQIVASAHGIATSGRDFSTQSGTGQFSSL